MGKSNQKTIMIKKELCDKSHFYTAINLEALTKAAKVLDGDAFKMWVYLSKNANGYTLQLSSKHAMDTFSLTKDRYNKAIHSLIENNYLVDTNTDPNETANRWTFYEVPLLGEANKPLQEKTTSLQVPNSKPCIGEQVRNNIKTIKTINEEHQLEPKHFAEMTAKQKDDYFRNNVFNKGD